MYEGLPFSASGIVAVIKHESHNSILEQHTKSTLFPILSIIIPSTGQATADIRYGVANHKDAYFSLNPNLSKSMSSAFATYTMTTMYPKKRLPHTSQKGSFSVVITLQLNFLSGSSYIFTSSFFAAHTSKRISMSKTKKQTTQIMKPTIKA